MQDMRELNEMGFITDEYQEMLEKQYQQALVNNQEENFMRKMQYPHHGHIKQKNGASQKQPLPKNRLKRKRKAQNQARKLARA